MKKLLCADFLNNWNAITFGLFYSSPIYLLTLFTVAWLYEGKWWGEGFESISAAVQTKRRSFSEFRRLYRSCSLNLPALCHISSVRETIGNEETKTTSHSQISASMRFSSVQTWPFEVWGIQNPNLLAFPLSLISFCRSTVHKSKFEPLASDQHCQYISWAVSGSQYPVPVLISSFIMHCVLATVSLLALASGVAAQCTGNDHPR